MIGINLVFDEPYIEPALVTAHEMHKALPYDWPIQMTYIYSDLDAMTSGSIVGDFVNKFGSSRRFVVIGIDANSLPPIQRYHFNNTVLFKALTPLFCDFDFPITIDSGFIVGKRFQEVLGDWDLALEALQGSLEATVFAYCIPSQSVEHLSKVRRHTRNYPMGGVLGFHGKRFRQRSIGAQLVSKMKESMSELVLPEQDLLCYTLSEQMLVPLERFDLVDASDLTIISPLKAPKFDMSFLADCGLHKIKGSLKPWHLWVLNPLKRHYLLARSDLEAKLPLATYPSIFKYRSECKYQKLANEFLLEFERSLVS